MYVSTSASTVGARSVEVAPYASTSDCRGIESPAGSDEEGEGQEGEGKEG